MYLSDISGAFDKVNRALVIGNLSQLGVRSIFLDFLNAYLLGALSEVLVLLDMIFQGTVVGTPLWNNFSVDVAEEVPQGRQEISRR